MNIWSLLRIRPWAVAHIEGNVQYPAINGEVRFYNTGEGVIIAAQIYGLPTGNGMCDSPVFGFHIHSGTSCTGNSSDRFADALTHYNPHNCPHPYHAGDMPPLFGVDGQAFSAFLTDRITINEIVGKTVIIHSAPDDFTSQPSGNSGTKIACGVIRNLR